MTANLSEEIRRNKFLLILLEDQVYKEKIKEMAEFLEKTGSKACYVCLSRPYADVMDDFKNSVMNADVFFFVDVLSSHYGTPEAVQNCIFVSEPTDLEGIGNAITKVIDENNCTAVILDTVSALLLYHQIYSITKFTNKLVSKNKEEKIKKLFIINRGESIPIDEIDMLTKDLGLFADKKIDVTAV